MKKYKVILADPPWDYGSSNSNERTKKWDSSKKEYKRRRFRGAASWYPLMKTEEIKNLKISKFCDKDCVLFLWATFPKLQDALEVIKTWGFNYKTIGFIWIKIAKNGIPRKRGIGHYTYPNSEPCLIATKGYPKINQRCSSILLTHEFLKQFSKKPDIQYLKIEAMFNGPYLELFSRRQKEGWDVWGNQVNSNISLL